MKIFLVYFLISSAVSVSSITVEISSVSLTLPDSESLVNNISCALFDVYKASIVALRNFCSNVTKTADGELQIVEKEAAQNTQFMLNAVRQDVNAVYQNFNVAFRKLSDMIREASKLGQTALRPAEKVWKELKYGVRRVTRNIRSIRTNLNKKLTEIKMENEEDTEEYNKAMHDLYSDILNKLSFEVRSATTMFQHALSLPTLKYYEVDLQDAYNNWAQYLQLPRKTPVDLFNSFRNLLNRLYNAIQTKFFLSGIPSDNAMWALSSIVWGDAVQSKRFIDSNMRRIASYIKASLIQIQTKFSKDSVAAKDAMDLLYKDIQNEIRWLIDLTEVPFKRMYNFTNNQLPFSMFPSSNKTYNGRFEDLLKYLRENGYPVSINHAISSVSYPEILQEDRIKEISSGYNNLVDLVQKLNNRNKSGFISSKMVLMKIEDDVYRFTFMINNLRSYVSQCAALIEDSYDQSSQEYKDAMSDLREDVKHKLDVTADFILNSMKRIHQYLISADVHLKHFESHDIVDQTDLTKTIMEDDLDKVFVEANKNIDTSMVKMTMTNLTNVIVGEEVPDMTASIVQNPNLDTLIDETRKIDEIAEVQQLYNIEEAGNNDNVSAQTAVKPNGLNSSEKQITGIILEPPTPFFETAKSTIIEVGPLQSSNTDSWEVPKDKIDLASNSSYLMKLVTQENTTTNNMNNQINEISSVPCIQAKFNGTTMISPDIERSCINETSVPLVSTISESGEELSAKEISNSINFTEDQISIVTSTIDTEENASVSSKSTVIAPVSSKELTTNTLSTTFVNSQEREIPPIATSIIESQTPSKCITFESSIEIDTSLDKSLPVARIELTQSTTDERFSTITEEEISTQSQIDTSTTTNMKKLSVPIVGVGLPATVTLTRPGSSEVITTQNIAKQVNEISSTSIENLTTVAESDFVLPVLDSLLLENTITATYPDVINKNINLMSQSCTSVDDHITNGVHIPSISATIPSEVKEVLKPIDNTSYNQDQLNSVSTSTNTNIETDFAVDTPPVFSTFPFLSNKVTQTHLFNDYDADQISKVDAARRSTMEVNSVCTVDNIIPSILPVSSLKGVNTDNINLILSPCSVQNQKGTMETNEILNVSTSMSSTLTSNSPATSIQHNINVLSTENSSTIDEVSHIVPSQNRINTVTNNVCKSVAESVSSTTDEIIPHVPVASSEEHKIMINNINELLLHGHINSEITGEDAGAFSPSALCKSTSAENTEMCINEISNQLDEILTPTYEQHQTNSITEVADLNRTLDTNRLTKISNEVLFPDHYIENLTNTLNKGSNVDATEVIDNKVLPSAQCTDSEIDTLTTVMESNTKLENIVNTTKNLTTLSSKDVITALDNEVNKIQSHALETNGALKTSTVCEILNPSISITEESTMSHMTSVISENEVPVHENSVVEDILAVEPLYLLWRLPKQGQTSKTICNPSPVENIEYGWVSFLVPGMNLPQAAGNIPSRSIPVSSITEKDVTSNVIISSSSHTDDETVQPIAMNMNFTTEGVKIDNVMFEQKSSLCEDMEIDLSTDIINEQSIKFGVHDLNDKIDLNISVDVSDSDENIESLGMNVSTIDCTKGACKN